jgi:alginate O-acetyltransferase complex protein AlgJ
MKEKLSSYSLIFSFLLIIILPLIFINTINGKISTTEKRVLAQFPALFAEKGELNNGIVQQIETWFNDNIGFRDEFIKIHSIISLDVFHISPTEKVQIGKDGWYFYTRDNNLEIAKGTYPLSEEVLKNIARSQEAIQKYYNDHGISYVLVLNPSKVSIYPEKIREGSFSIRETPIDILTKYLKENTTVNVISTKDALITAKQTQTVYFKTDTHWNYEGAYVGYKTIIDDLNEMGIVHNITPVSVNRFPTTFRGEFSAMMGNENSLPLDQVNGIEIVDKKAINVTQGELFNQINQIKQKHNILEGSFVFTNPSVEKKKILIYGDSMFEYWNIPELFAENFSELIYVRSRVMYNDFTMAVQPDIVISEWAERFINLLPSAYIPWNLAEPLKNPQAIIISTTTPTDIKSGVKYSFNITVKNTGTESWSESKGIRLCIFQDGQGDQGYRIKLPDNVEVKPGESYTFTLTDFQAPPHPSTYLEYQMAQEGVAYFGEIKRVDIRVK